MTDIWQQDWPNLSAHLNEVLECEPEQRAEWLAAFAARDPEMAARIAQVLAAHEQQGFSEFLAGPSPAPHVETAEATLIGRRVGPYVIEAELGRGGMGSVWRARRADGRYEGIVAIKFVHAAWIGRAGEQRFRIEGRLLGRLNHPNISRLVDAGMMDDTQPYLVLEYVEGEPIDGYCERRGLGAEGRIRLFLDVLAAVAHAHRHLIVHRDIKPANLFVTHDGTVKLLDFGIAKLLQDDSGLELPTQSSVVALTPQYAAPEQLLGQAVTTATDVYALGLVLYALLTGVHPIKTGARSRADLLHAVLSEDPPRASAVAELAAIPAPALAGDLDNILAKALKKDAAERYSTAGAFADDLRRFLTHQPVQARPDTITYRAAKFARRHRGALAASLVIVAAIAAGTVGTLVQAARAKASAVQAVQARGRALQQLSYAEGTNEFLSFLLQAASSKAFTSQELLQRGERLVQGEFTDDADLRAKLLLTLGSIYGEIQDQKNAERLLLAGQAAARAGKDASVQADADCNLALQLGDENKFDQSFALLDAAIRSARADPGMDSGILALCLANRSQVRFLRKDAEAALDDAQAALVALGNPRPGQRNQALLAHMVLADAHGLRGDSALAVAEQERVLADLEHMGRGQTSSAITEINSLGVNLSKSGQWLRAAAVYERGLAIARDAEGAEGTRPSIESNYAKLLVALGRAAEAQPLFENALQSAKSRGSTRAIAMVTLLAAPAWCETGDLAGCAARLDSAAQQLRLQLPPGHTVLGTLETEEAQLALDRHDPALASRHLEAALQIFAAGSDHNPNELRAQAMLAEAELELGDLGAAARDAAAAVDKAHAALHGFPGSAWHGGALLTQGRVYRARGDNAAARSVLRQALDELRATEGEDAAATRQAQALLQAL